MSERRSIEEVGAILRRRRRELAEYEQATREEWEADLLAYDRLLCEAAAMLEVAVPVPVPPAEPLTADQRARLESGLAAAGLDVAA